MDDPIEPEEVNPDELRGRSAGDAEDDERDARRLVRPLWDWSNGGSPIIAATLMLVVLVIGACTSGGRRCAD